MMKNFVSEEVKIFRRATLASVITSTYPMIVVGCYFGVTPWIFNRLSIDESDFSFAILLFGIFFINLKLDPKPVVFKVLNGPGEPGEVANP